jgi:hypothetical protein
MTRPQMLPTPVELVKLQLHRQSMYGQSASGSHQFESGEFELWQNGVSTAIQLPAGLCGRDDFPASAWLNDAGQFTAGDGAAFYFLPPSGGRCVVDVTSQVQVNRGGFRYNHSTGHFIKTVTVTNTSGCSIWGPISVALANVPANGTLFGISGATLCDPLRGVRT